MSIYSVGTVGNNATLKGLKSHARSRLSAFKVTEVRVESRYAPRVADLSQQVSVDFLLICHLTANANGIPA